MLGKDVVDRRNHKARSSGHMPVAGKVRETEE